MRNDLVDALYDIAGVPRPSEGTKDLLDSFMVYSLEQLKDVFGEGVRITAYIKIENAAKPIHYFTETSEGSVSCDFDVRGEIDHRKEFV